MKKLTLVLPFLLVLVYVVGPKFDRPVFSAEMPELELNLSMVDSYVIQKEGALQIRPDNEARIVWFNDSTKQQTEYCLLYLHGFSASWYEGFPTHINLSQQFGANLYLSRLAAHGLDDKDAMAQMSPENLYDSAKEALLLASVLGQKVVVMGTSTGGTLALKLAADFPELVHALVLLSPNIKINNPSAFLVSGPWGLQFAKLNGDGSAYRDLGPGMEIEDNYWYRKYRWEAIVYLQQLLDFTMKVETFRKITQPLFLGYYYKNKTEQDPVVRVDAMLDMFQSVSTPESLKQKQAFPESGNHVIGCEDLSGSAHKVEEAIFSFLKLL